MTIKTKYYNINNLLRFSVTNENRSLLPNPEYSYYESNKSSLIDFKLTVGDFHPDLQNCKSLKSNIFLKENLDNIFFNLNK